MPIDGLMSAAEVGALYHISRQRVSILAQHRKVGRHLGRMWVFTPEEVKAMQPGKGGRPKKESGTFDIPPFDDFHAEERVECNLVGEVGSFGGVRFIG